MGTTSRKTDQISGMDQRRRAAMQRHADRGFETATEIVRLVRSFRAVLAGHALKYRTVDGLGAVASFTGDVERELARYKNKFLGIREPSLSSFAKCAEQQINALATKAIAQAKDQCPLLALSGHGVLRCTCLLLTQSGHSAIVGAYVKLSIVVTAHGRHETDGPEEQAASRPKGARE